MRSSDNGAFAAPEGSKAMVTRFQKRVLGADGPPTTPDDQPWGTGSYQAPSRPTSLLPLGDQRQGWYPGV